MSSDTYSVPKDRCQNCGSLVTSDFRHGIRTDGKYAYRKDTIKHAAEFWDCNKTDAVLRLCEFTWMMVDALERALNHPHMTLELVDLLSTPRVSI